MARRPQIERFNEVVKSKFQIYNSLFLTLPFPSIKNTALLLPLFAETCKEGFAAGLSPNQIVTNFFDTYLKDLSEKRIATIYSSPLLNISKGRWCFLMLLRTRASPT